ncbi:MAG: hypothetical protein LQ352_005249 [Teloschistes flavicans]|nr:MAG: hypothetical protein LQ352_005249 [Teloschistes flavicans]
MAQHANSSPLDRLPNDILEPILFQLPDLHSLKSFLSAYPSAVRLVGKLLFKIVRLIAKREDWPILRDIDARMKLLRITRFPYPDIISETQHLTDTLQQIIAQADAG